MNATSLLVTIAGLSISLTAATQAQPGPGGDAGRPPIAGPAGSGDRPDKPDFPPFDEVTKGYEKIVSTVDGKSFYTLYKREKDGDLLAELPREYDKQNCYIATAVSGGIPAAGIQFGEQFVKWRRYDKRLALLQPNLETRTTGDKESESSRNTQFTDRVLIDVPIVAMGPGGGPVINMTDLLAKNATVFFGNEAARANTRLISIAKAKAFPENVELAFEMPNAEGILTTIHYSWSVLPEKTDYKPREADYRLGYFTTAFTDLNKVGEDTTKTRYINRWRLEKADPSLKMSPPKQPIVFYVEHTVPIKYRNAVREGALEWNKAFEKVGIINAVEVYQQDALTGAHMEKDPEDVRYNFLRWHTNNLSFAIGPSRVDPRTGQILDADVLMNDGWVRFAAGQYRQVLPQIATEAFTPETLAWLDKRPQWDPRVRLAEPAERDTILAERAHRLATQGPAPFAGHPLANADATLLGDDQYDGLYGHISQKNGCCMNSFHRGMDLAMVRLDMIDLDMRGQGKDNDDADDDNVPDEFISAVIKDVMMHEVGHVLGLRHNFKASSIYTIEQINSPAWQGKAITGSVMDYNAMNYFFDEGSTQGPYVMPTVGPYDYWVIEYGYTFDKDLGPILARVSEPELAYATDENLADADPLVRQRDMGADALTFVETEMEMVRDLRSKLLDRVVKEGDSWGKARDAYGTLLNLHTRDVVTAARFVGGSNINRDRRGDPGEREPVTPASVDEQRRALKFVIDNTFQTEAFGLTPELVSKFTTDKWMDEGRGAFMSRTNYDPHDRILGIQAAALTNLLNPTTLNRVFDNEFAIPAGRDALTLPELISTITDAAFTELSAVPASRSTVRDPMISSMRRNLQREVVSRLIDLTMPDGMTGAAAKPVATLAAYQLRELNARMTKVLDGRDSMVDAYTIAHLEETKGRIEKALDAGYIYNLNDVSITMPAIPFFLGDQPKD